jgi:hypothetical protein
MLGIADLMPDCWLEVSLHPKVLRPANSIKVFRGFPWSQSKCSICTQIPRCTACFPCSPPNGNIEISPCTNVTLTLGWVTLFMGDMGEEPYTEKKESNCQTKKFKIWPWALQRALHQGELAYRSSVAI